MKWLAFDNGWCSKEVDATDHSIGYPFVLVGSELWGWFIGEDCCSFWSWEMMEKEGFKSEGNKKVFGIW
jgi:hypothetical protein